MDSIPSLHVLHVAECSFAVLKIMVSVSSSIASLTMQSIKGVTPLCGEVLQHFKALKYLNISYCDELSYLWESEATACEILVSLQKLEVNECQNLISFGEKDVDLNVSMKSVREVTIRSCTSLESYNRPVSIEKLVIRGCYSFKSLTLPTMDGVPSTLKLLRIGCEDV
ncbi:uncharacterized protein LOC143569914 [Bidens hawaiensis]|uniref:uncharacterized protein LOC143569914 n=1 Tax=Bidens hawaiensis TaxID=980011 RepID=UPI00404A1887